MAKLWDSRRSKVPYGNHFTMFETVGPMWILLPNVVNIAYTILPRALRSWKENLGKVQVERNGGDGCWLLTLINTQPRFLRNCIMGMHQACGSREPNFCAVSTQTISSISVRAGPFPHPFQILLPRCYGNISLLQCRRIREHCSRASSQRNYWQEGPVKLRHGY